MIFLLGDESFSYTYGEKLATDSLDGKKNPIQGRADLITQSVPRMRESETISK